MRERFSGLYQEHYEHVLRYALRRTRLRARSVV